MKLNLSHCGRAAARRRGMTLVELMVAFSLVLVVITTMSLVYIFGMRCFSAMNNYADMDAKTRMSLDKMLKEIRGSSHVVGYQTNATTVWLKVGNIVASPPVTNLFTWQ